MDALTHDALESAIRLAWNFIGAMRGRAAEREAFLREAAEIRAADLSVELYGVDVARDPLADAMDRWAPK